MTGASADAWTFIVRRYGEPGVQAACLALQDAHGQCVGFLMWRAWTLAVRRPVSPERLDRAVETARIWEVEVAQPMRAARRRLSRPLPDIDDEARGGLRRGALDLEIAAERVLIEALARLIPTGAVDDTRQPVAALAQAALAWGGSAPEVLLAKLAGAC